MTVIIGIDPGKNGGLAVLSTMNKVKVLTIPMPETAKDLFLFLSNYMTNHGSVQAFVEKVNAGPRMGSSAAFKFGQSVGEIRMAVLAAGMRLEYVTPQKWQKEFGLLVKGRGLGQDDTSKKNRNKAKAQELFPAIKVTHAVADALLIAEYGRRINSN